MYELEIVGETLPSPTTISGFDPHYCARSHNVNQCAVNVPQGLDKVPQKYSIVFIHVFKG